MSVFLTFCLSVCLSFSLSVCLSLHPSIRLFESRNPVLAALYPERSRVGINLLSMLEWIGFKSPFKS